MELFRLLGTIAIDNSEAIQSIEKTTGEASKAESKLQKGFSKIGSAAIKVAKVVGAAAVAGTVAITKSAVQSYAEYEQLVGGVDTLFKDSSKRVQEYAAMAYKTAGLSANEYMETVTSFSASLLQGLGGDTKKAADIADMAMVDMADNVNKMGSSMQSIQDAYQGFAKQNYTMLDNLKLGYGGTQQEMIRLINDSGILEEEISSLDGVSFDQMIQAIHEIQNQLGITGTTAKEAEETISGSASSMKAAWSNLMTGLADSSQNVDALFSEFAKSAFTFAKNLIPAVQTTIKQLFSLVGNILGSGQIGDALQKGIKQDLPRMMQAGAEMLQKIGEGLKTNLPVFVASALSIISNFTSTIRQNAPALIQSGLNLIVNLAQGLMNSLPVLISKIPTIVSNIAKVISDNAPKLISAALKLIKTLATGLIKAIPTLVANIPKIIKAVVDVFLAYGWASLGKSVIKAVAKGIKSGVGAMANIGKHAVTKLGSGISSLKGWVGGKAASIAKNVVNRIKSGFSGIASAGRNLVQGIWRGISGAGGGLFSKVTSFAKSIVNKMKSALVIRSPSKVAEEEVGKNLALGVAEGIAKNGKYAKKKASELATAIVEAAKKKLDKYKTYNDMTLAAEIAFWDQIRRKCKKGTDARLEADKEYFEKKKDLTQQLKELEDDYINKIDEANQKIADRAKSLLDTFNLFDEFAIKVDEEKPLTGSKLIDNLQSQVNALTDWTGQMATLGDKIGDTALYKAIQDMGVSSLQQVQLINQMSEAELQRYVELYDKRAEIAKKQAESELGGEVMKEMMEAYKDYENAVGSLGAVVSEKFAGIGDIIETAMTSADKLTGIKIDNMTDLLKNGLADMTDDTQSAFKSILESISSSMTSAVGNVESAVARMQSALASIAGRGISANIDISSAANVKANAKGGILTKPTIFGYTPATNTYQLGGEAGDEAIAPISTLKQYVAEAVAAQNGNTEALMGQMVVLLQKLLDKDTDVYMDGDKVTQKVNKKLGFAL